MTDAAAVATPGRYFYLDIARIAAILGVAAIHNWSLLHVLTPGTRHWWAVDVAYTIGRWAVPVFVMISGGLLLRPHRAMSAGAFYRRRLWRIGVPAVFWIVAYFVFRATVLDQELTRSIVVTDLVAARPFTHLYFVYVIAGLYLITPLLQPFIASRGRRDVALAAFAFLGIWALDAAFAYLVGVGTSVDALTYWFPFLGYYLAGSALFGMKLSPRAVRWIAIGVVAAVIIQVLITYPLTVFTEGAWRNYPSSYWSPFTIAASLGIFVLAARESAGQHQTAWLGRAARRLGEATFGVYLVHEMLLYLHSINFVQGPPEALVTARIPTYVFAVVGSFAIVLVARRIPFLRSIF